MRLLQIMFFVSFVGFLAAMWAYRNGIAWADKAAIFFGMAGALVGIGLFIAQAISNLPRDSEKD